MRQNDHYQQIKGQRQQNTVCNYKAVNKIQLGKAYSNTTRQSSESRHSK